MKGKIHLSIVAAFLLTLVGCSQTSMYGHHQSGIHHKHGSSKEEPALIIKPANFSGRAWFDTDKSVLKAKGKAELNRLIKELMQARKQGLISSHSKIAVIGHADSRGSHAYNQRLSERRAKAVAAYMSKNGVPSTAIRASGRGETQPVASNRTRSGMQQNRRVEVHLYGESVKVVYD